VIGGALTTYASWRWTLLINVPIAIITAAVATRELRESRVTGEHHYDIPGALAVTAGLLSLVYGFTRAQLDGWGSTTTVAFLAVAVVLITTFVLWERRTATPLLPLRVVMDRNRGGSFLAALLVGIALFGTFLFLTYYLQGTLHYSALKSGFAFLPFSAGIIFSATMASQFLPRFGPRALMTFGLLMGAVGLVWFTQIGLHTSYVTHVLPAELIVSMGLGFAFVPFSSTALIGVAPHDAGVASALVNATQQVGGSLGTALLNTVAASATATYIAAHHAGSTFTSLGNVHGYTTGFTVSAVVLFLAAIAAVTLVRASRHDLPPSDPFAALELEMA
jgi:MFS family permease